MTFQPVFIIGAGRSGTNILRDTLTTIPGWCTWDCDEINLIWRHGNLDLPNDLMNEKHATDRVKKFIHRQFDKLHHTTGARVIVEKTCANSLRIPFIDAIYPNARYIYIVRDGRDVALSAAKRWTASIEVGYLLKKLRYVPVSDVPYHGIKFLRNRLAQAVSKEKRQRSWGPVFEGMREWVRDYPLVDVCAKQWSECVECSDDALSNIEKSRWIKVQYEDLVTDPRSVLTEISKWYSADDVVSQIPEEAIGAIHASSLYGWKSRRDRFTPHSLSIMERSLERHKYEPSSG